MDTIVDLVRGNRHQEIKPKPAERFDLSNSVVNDYKKKESNIDPNIDVQERIVETLADGFNTVFVSIQELHGRLDKIERKLIDIEYRVAEINNRQDTLEKYIRNRDERMNNHLIRQFAMTGGVANFIRTKTDCDIPWK